VQIKEVSSHFRNGWVFLVVMPKKLTEAKFEEEQFNKIQPFILDNIIIKAKLNCVNKKKEDEPQA
jgi:hypothetical protein